MGLVVTVPPTTEPLTLDEAKLQVRVDPENTDEDALLQAYISAARLTCERDTRRCIAPATYRLTLDGFPACDRPIKLPVPPLVSVSSITYVDADGMTQTLSTGLYIVDAASEPGRIVAMPGTSWPTTRDQPAAVSIVFNAGYSTVPEDFKTAMRLMVGSWFKNREAVQDQQTYSLLGGAEAILNQLSWGCYA